MSVLMSILIAATTVPVATFDSVELNGRGRIVLRHGAAQRVTITQGSADVTRMRVAPDGKLVIDACELRCPANYRLEMEIVTPRIEGVAIRGSGDIRAEGDLPGTRDLDVAISGSGRIDTRAVRAANVNAAISGSGTMLISADEMLTTAISGSGDVTYWGEPRLQTAIQGSGRINRGR